MIPTFARSMLKVFALLGCDFLPTFHGVSHSLGMEVFMNMFKRGPARTPDDFFNSMLKIYQEKYSSFNRLFPQENPHTHPLVLEKNKKTWSKNHFLTILRILAKYYFFQLKKSKILRKISRSDWIWNIRNILSVRPHPI